MPQSKHTQGPWRVGEGESSITTVNGEHVLSLPYPLYPASQPDEFSSNARLMAAAPDLLKACKGIVQAYQYAKKCGGKFELDDYACEVLAQAIAKAEGGKSEKN